MRLFIFACLAVNLAGAATYSEEKKTMKQIRTLMSYSYPVDPVRIVTIPDMDLSYALASTLVKWDHDKQFMGAVAESWEPIAENIYRFKIRTGLKWSDGSALTSSDVKNSFERAFKDYPEDLRSLINLIKKISTPDTSTVEFHLTVKAQGSSLLGKLTEPNYGISKVKADGKIDLGTSSGAFYLTKNTSSEIVLKKNPHWVFVRENMPEEIIIRKPQEKVDLQTVMLEEEWPNLVEVNSLLSGELLNRYKANHFEIWTRPMDKIFLLQLSKNFVLSEGPALFRYLYQALDRQILTQEISGFSLTKQVFPLGYQLYDESLDAKAPPKAALPDIFKKKPLRVLLASTRVNPVLQENIKKVLTQALGISPEYIFTTLDKLGEHKKLGDYDVYVSTMGLADPDPEGIMSYYFEGDTRVVQSGNEPFVSRLDAARKEKDKSKSLQLMRELMTDATLKGHVLPLFHLSTVAIGRQPLDFSNVPSSDESVTLSKIQFKEESKK